MSRKALISLKELSDDRRGPSGEAQWEWRPVAEYVVAEHMDPAVALSLWFLEQDEDELPHGEYKLNLPGEVAGASAHFPYVSRMALAA